LVLPGIELWFLGCPAQSLAITLTELSQLYLLHATNFLFFKVNEVEVDQSLGIQSGVMTALSVVGGLDSRPRIGGRVMAEGLGPGESQ
jgi:hypothetical protein